MAEERINDHITLMRIKTAGDIEELLEMIARDMGSEKIGHVAVSGAEMNSGEAIMKACRGRVPAARYPIMIVQRAPITYSKEGKAGHIRATHHLNIRIVDKVSDRTSDAQRRDMESSIQQTFEELLGRLDYYSRKIIGQGTMPYTFDFDKIPLRPVSHLTVNNELGWEAQNIRIGRMGNAAYFPPRNY